MNPAAFVPISVRFTIVAAVTCVLAWQGCGTPLHAQPLDFNRDIRPILAENCFYCHGQDANKRQADLRLDQRDAAIAAGAVAPGDAANSAMIARILSDDPEQQMPPPKSNRRLSADQKKTLERWIAEGANYDQHWAFVPPSRPAEPAVHPVIPLLEGRPRRVQIRRAESRPVGRLPGNNRGQLRYSFTGRNDTDLADITKNLGQDWIFLETLYRIYSTAGYNIAHIDTTAAIMRENGLDPADIDRIEAVVNSACRMFLAAYRAAPSAPAAN